MSKSNNPSRSSNNPSRLNGGVSLVRSDKSESREASTWRTPSPVSPLVSAAVAGEDGYGNLRLSPDQEDMLVNEAKEREPTADIHRRLVGLTGQAGVSSLLGVPFDRRITEDYEGDDGYDIAVPCKGRSDPLRIEVKTTENWSSPERTVSSEKINKADYFVLCSTHAPGRNVDIVGYIERPLLKQQGKAYGRDGYLLAPEYLRPIGNVELRPDDFRAAMKGSRRRYH